MSAGQLDRRRSISSSSRSASAALLPSPSLEGNSDFEPCAATASLFLFAQGSTILSLHHDTLAVDRRFEAHRDDICFIAVDNVSERGAGRLVVSYDASQTAIVWDLFTGQEIARFASFELIRVAAWMRNGNIAFGNAKGDMIIFEPSTSEHVSARTIFDPITALAPASDCQSYGIGYRNGSILIATLEPNFTIIHTLTTSRGPSPIKSLAWHASSTKQRSDMLATQTVDGDLFVWSVSKGPDKEPPRVIRALKRSESSPTTPKWLAWSKNGRIVQYADGETWSWDVRTKHVTYELIPTIQGVKGIANYGPTATLFTIGPNNTVQQYDVAMPALLAESTHVPVNRVSTPSDGLNLPPPNAPTPTSQFGSEPRDLLAKSSPRSTPTFEIITSEMNKRDRSNVRSPETGSTFALPSSRSLPSSRHSRTVYSATTGTSFSTSSPLYTSQSDVFHSGHDRKYAPSSTAGSGARRGSSRLRNEFIPSPVDQPIEELFPHTRTKLHEVPFNPEDRLDGAISDPNDFRKRMLKIVFGWDGDIVDLINDEFKRLDAGSQHAIILGRWLGLLDLDVLLSMATSTDSRYTGWMLLALYQLSNNQHETKKLGHALVQKLVATGDIHSAVAVLIGMGDGNDGIEIYVARNMYMEAILLTCLLMPTEWSRQSYLVRRWGEYVVQSSEQHLAIRCFSCTEQDAPESWASPSAQMTGILASKLASNPITPLEITPIPLKTSPNSSRIAAKNQALKLITSFPAEPARAFKFPGLASADRTPTNAPGVTPIESALGDSIMSPGGFGSHRQKYNRQTRSTTPGQSRQRLPSIGETPSDVASPGLPLPTKSGDPSHKKGGSVGAVLNSQQKTGNGGEEVVYLTSARYTPRGEATDHSSRDERGNNLTIAVKPRSGSKSSQKRGGSRDRNPEGLCIKPPPIQRAQSSTPDTDFSSQYDHKRLGSDAVALSPTATAGSARSAPGASVGSRSIDEYISSLDEASYYHQKQRNESDHGAKNHSKGTPKSQLKEPRGRSDQRYIQPAKRSPSSPIPMSPEDLALYSTSGNESLLSLTVSENTRKPRSKSSHRTTRSAQRHSSKGRGRRPSSRTSDTTGRKHSETRQARSRGRDSNVGFKSPSSPVPMSPSGHGNGLDEHLRLVEMNRRTRVGSKERSVSRRRERGTSSRRDPSPDRRRTRERSRSRQAQEYGFSSDNRSDQTRARNFQSSADELTSPDAAYPSGLLWTQRDLERTRRELAAAELEARRLSLARRPSAPSIPLPGETISPQMGPPPARGNNSESPVLTNGSFSQRVIGRQNGSPVTSSHSDSNQSNRPPPPAIGLPATPRAMRHPKYGGGHEAPPVPDVSIPEKQENHMSADEVTAMMMNVARASSAPVPEETITKPGDGIPTHPHFQPQLPSSRTTTNFTHRRESSHDALLPATQYRRPSLGESNRKTTEVICPPPLPELRHLQSPPPPPPPPHPEENRSNYIDTPHPERNSFISGISGVGTINIAIDEPAVLSPVDPSHGAGGNNTSLSRKNSNSDSHRRGRSANDNFTNKFRNFTDRMRSTSRGRNAHGSPPEDAECMSPYESVQNASMINVMENKG